MLRHSIFTDRHEPLVPVDMNLEQAKFTNEILAVQQTSLWFLPEVLMEVERCGPKTRLSIAGGWSRRIFHSCSCSVVISCDNGWWCLWFNQWGSGMLVVSGCGWMCQVPTSMRTVIATHQAQPSEVGELCDVRPHCDCLKQHFLVIFGVISPCKK